MTYSTRLEAASVGAVSYFTGKPCPHGHVAERYTSNSTCVDCTPMRNKTQYHKDPKRHITRSTAYLKVHRHRYTETRKDGWLRRRYSITAADYMAMLSNQNGMCALCGGQERVKGQRLAVDHDHQSGRVRGLLCFTCNTAVGKLEKRGVSPTQLNAYLTR